MPARNAKALVEQAAACGVPPEVTLRGTGLALAALGAPGARVSYRQHIGLHRNVADFGVPDDFGFSGAEFSISSYGMLGYAMMSSATLGQAIRIALKYYRTAGPLLAVSFEPGDALSSIVAVNVFDLQDDVLRLVTEEIFSTFPSLLEVLLGAPETAARVELGYPEPRNAALYAAFFGCPVSFAHRFARYTLSSALLDRRLVQADADSALLFEESCRALLADIERHDSVANRVRHLLLASAGTVLTAEAVAGQLGVGPRTLRRRLAAEGVSFQALLDEVRCSVAVDYLTSTELSTQDIAELIGFSEATNFRRAFVRWTERTPASFRRRL